MLIKIRLYGSVLALKYLWVFLGGLGGPSLAPAQAREVGQGRAGAGDSLSHERLLICFKYGSLLSTPTYAPGINSCFRTSTRSLVPLSAGARAHLPPLHRHALCTSLGGSTALWRPRHREELQS